MTYRCLQPEGHIFEAPSPENSQRVGLLPLCPECATVGLPDDESLVADHLQLSA